MIPKEKAKELVNKYYGSDTKAGLPLTIYWSSAKACALIAVDEILKSEPRNPNDVDWDDAGGTHEYFFVAQMEDAEKYWKEVKQEIEKL